MDKFSCFSCSLAYIHIFTVGFLLTTIIDEEKEEVARSWLVDKPGYDVIVATTAFGMGIDKSNV